jgi:hypothetical protein
LPGKKSSYSGGRDQEDCSLKPAWALRAYLKKPITKNWAGGVAQGENPEFKIQYLKKKFAFCKLPLAHFCIKISLEHIHVSLQFSSIGLFSLE